MNIKISKTTFNENSKEQVPLIINGIDVGSYNLGIYSKWYMQRINKGERTIPSVEKFVNGLLLKEYGIDTRKWKEDVSFYKEALRIIKCDSIGEWFNKYMEKETNY